MFQWVLRRWCWACACLMWFGWILCLHLRYGKWHVLPLGLLLFEWGFLPMPKTPREVKPRILFVFGFTLNGSDFFAVDRYLVRRKVTNRKHLLVWCSTIHRQQKTHSVRFSEGGCVRTEIWWFDSSYLCLAVVPISLLSEPIPSQVLAGIKSAPEEIDHCDTELRDRTRASQETPGAWLPTLIYFIKYIKYRRNPFHH